MSDRELLELAAKAAGYTGKFAGWPGMDDRHGISSGIYVEQSDCYWNPLEDDGDALRLAVKLGMDIRIYGTDVRVACCGVIAMEGAPYLYAATRRAIVRAAADIGRNMP